MNKTEKLFQSGQSVWYDNIQRKLLDNGELEGMINRHEIFGITSNPSIFQNAIAKSTDYDSALKPMAWSGWSAEEIFWELAVEDIRTAADLFRPLYTETNGGDGYVSLEVSPLLAYDTAETYAEALGLWQRVDRENLMVKIPATKEGIKAIRKSICAGININVTLIFSLERYQEVIDAYLGGLEDRLAQGKQIDNIASVASFFVSRVDSKMDPKLQEIIEKGGTSGKIAEGLAGTIAVSNVKLAYQVYKKNFTSDRFAKLQEAGAKLQRPLWASTSTKNPAYRDVMYIEELVGPDTVNTVPPQTLKAFIEHGNTNNTIDVGVDQAAENISKLDDLGISMKEVTQDLEDEGVKAFEDAFKALLESIQIKMLSAQKELGPLFKETKLQLGTLKNTNSIKRLFEVDPTLWTDDPNGQIEITKRCNWLNAPWNKYPDEEEYLAIRKHCRNQGYKKVVLLGMGGSSLAPEVLRVIHGISKFNDFDGLDLVILDSTDPAQVKEVSQFAELEKTLFIVSSKSGGTAEVNAFLDYFWDKCFQQFGKKAGEKFIAITDPGTNLEKIANEKGFWHVYSGDPMVGGRNSALTVFGLIPAALIGMDTDKLLRSAIKIAEQCVPEVPVEANPGAVLGAILGSAWKSGRDKLTIVTDTDWESFGNWLEQLIAESTGKQGKGIVPIVQEPEQEPAAYLHDRFFVYLKSNGEKSKFAEELRSFGQPVVELTVDDSYDIGGQFYLWEIATAVVCSLMKVNSFDQPDVQDNKTRTVKKTEEYGKNGKLSEGEPIHKDKIIQIFCDYDLPKFENETLNSYVLKIIKNWVKTGDFVAINAYLPRNSQMVAELNKLRNQIINEFHVATTLGFGPRFLHSTGQLHKGGPNNAIIIQIAADPIEDLLIPGENLSFGILEKAQALGDYESLTARKKRVIRIQLDKPEVKLLLR